MINSLALRNFKSINNEVPLDFKNLSIICGSNSSGKSSILQALLMLSQTFSSTYYKRSVSLNGKLVRLGSFADILNHAYTGDDKNIDLEIEMEFSNRQSWMSISKLKLNLTFTCASESGRKFDSEFHPEVISGAVELATWGDDSYECIHFHAPESSKANQDLFSVSKFESKKKVDIGKEYPDYKIEGVSRSSLIPYDLSIVYDSTKKISQVLVPYLIGTSGYLKTIKEEEQVSLEKISIPVAVLDKMRSLIQKEAAEQTKSFVIPDEIRSMIEESNERRDIERVRMLLARQSIVLTADLIEVPSKTTSIDIKYWRALVDRLDEKERKALFDFLIRNRDEVQGVWYINSKKSWGKARYTLQSFSELNLFVSYFLPKKLKYLGPLRNEPQAMYQAFDLSEPTMVGLKGENTAAVLHINKSVRVTYPLAVTTEDGKIEIITKRETLGVACTEWLTYLGVVTEFETFDKGKLGYELQVKTSEGDRLQDLTHVGVGVSQVLPIVVMALLADSDDVLIFEQPELHLHPKVQSRLADFFIAITMGSNQCLIETHSEYIINRLRLRIAQSRDPSLKNRSNVLFVEKPEKLSKFQTVDITAFGSIIDWPKDFFDQTDIEVENILLEAVAKKQELKDEKHAQRSE
ncbi:DUF3696 domain-containing protein [Pseudomonas alliivorans]|nr:DUF3696 domain-containing protein [Pseudomonas alliivorans]